MPLNIPVGYGLAVLQHSQPFSGQTQLVTFGFKNDTVGGDALAIATDIAGFWSDTGKVFVPSAVADSAQFDLCRVYLQDEPDLTTAEFIVNLAGTRTSQPPSPQVSLVVKKRTAGVGRRYRGRFYLPAAFLVATDVGPSGIIQPTPLGVLQTKLNTFRTDLISADLTMVLLHTEAPFTPTLVTSLVANQLIGTQRRRVR